MLKWWKLVHRFYWISFHGEFTNKRFSRAYTYKSKVKEMLCGIFSLWYLTYNKSLQRNKTEIFELKIVLRSWQHVFWNFPEFESCFICNLVSAKLILSDSSCYNGHFDALFILAPFDFLLLAPVRGPGSASIEQLSFDPPLSGDIYKDTARQIEFSTRRFLQQR